VARTARARTLSDSCSSDFGVEGCGMANHPYKLCLYYVQELYGGLTLPGTLDFTA
jgi:hypothetical protein